MKKLLFTFLISASLISFAQAPQEISYQGVARNASGSLLSNQNIGIKLDLHQGSAGGSIVFSETHSKTTNAFGLFTLGIGSANTAAFTAINWANGPYFLEVSMDPAGGSSYTSVGTQQFMSVPYALYAKTAGNASPTPTITINAPNTVTSAAGGYTINIPASATYSAGTGINVSGNTISNTAPDQTVVLNAAGAATVTGTYPSFTINTPTTQVYSAGNGIDITGGVISNTAAAVTPTIVGTGATTVTGTYPNLTINTPTTQTYSAGNGIDITGGVISNTAAAVTPTIVGTGATTVTGTYPNLTINTPTVAPDQAVSLTGTGTATVTGSYPNFTVNVPAGASLPTAFNGQFLFNNGTIWDTLPRNNLYFDGTNFGIGTTAPQANFHVVGAGRFDASVSTPQIYTDNIKITGGTNGQVLTSDASGNGTWQNPITPTVTSTGIAVVTPTAGNTFNVDVPVPVLSYTPGTNVLSLTQGSAVTTATLNGTGSNTVSIVGSGLATVTPTTGSTFTVSVPNPTISIASGSLSISNGNSVAIPSPSLTINSNSLTINGPGGNTVVLPTASTTSLTQGSNVTVSGSAPNYTVSAPAYSISIPGGNVVQITNGVSTSTSAINVTSLTLNGTNNNILSAGGNTVALNTYTPGTGITMTGTAPNYTLSSPNQSLTINSNSLSITGGNTITLPTSSTTTLTQGTNVTVTGTAPSYTVSSVTPTLNVVGGALTGSYPTQTLTIPTSSTTTITQGAGVTVTGSAPNYTISSASQSLSVSGNSLSITGANTVTIPTTSVVAGNTNITVASSGNTYSVSAVTPTLNVVGGSIAGSYPTQTITIPAATAYVGTTNNITVTSNTINLATTGVTANTYGANASNTVPTFSVDAYGRLVTAGQYIPSVLGDVTGSINSTTVTKLRGTNISAVAPTVNQVLQFTGGSWTPNTLAPQVLSLSGTTLTSGPLTNSVNLSSLSVWSKSLSAVYPTTLTDNVGIGTATPSWPLHVYGMADPLQIMVQNTGGAFKTGYAIKTATQEWFMGKETGGSAGLHFTDMTNGQVRMAIETSGNVGIGTTNPNAMLDIQNAGASYGGLQIDMNAGNSNNAMQVTHNGLGNLAYFEINNTGSTAKTIEAKNNGSSDVINAIHTGSGNGAAGYFQINNSSSNGVAVDAYSNGNNPTIRGFASGLAEAGSFNINNPASNANALFAGSNANTFSLRAINTGANSGAAFFDITNASNTNNTMEVYNSAKGTAIFATNTSSTNATANISNTGTGMALWAHNTSNTDPAAYIINNGAYHGLEVSSAGGKAINASNNSNTNAAIDVTNTGTGNALNVNGKVRIADGTQAFGRVLTSDAAGNATWQAAGGASGWGLSGNSLTGTEFLGSTNPQDVIFKSAGTELMRLKSSNAITFTAGQYSMTASSSGNPAFTLTGPNFQSTQMNIKTTAAVTSVGNLGSIGFSDGTNSTTQAYIQGQREAAGGVPGDLPTALIFYTTADGSGTEGERMRINNAGKVGIGTTLPSAMLHALNAATTGSSGRFDNNSSANTADAVLVQNSSTGAGVHVIATGTSTVGLWLENAHLKSTQASASATSTVAVSGITTIALTPTGCTDVKGNVLAVVTHSGNINSGNSATFRVTFSKPYQTAPTVILTPTTDFGFLYYYVSSITTTSFNVTIRSNTAGTESRTNFGLNYMVIE